MLGIILILLYIKLLYSNHVHLWISSFKSYTFILLFHVLYNLIQSYILIWYHSSMRWWSCTVMIYISLSFIFCLEEIINKILPKHFFIHEQCGLIWRYHILPIILWNFTTNVLCLKLYLELYYTGYWIFMKKGAYIV